MTPSWRTALRRGTVPLVLGVLCLLASLPTIENLESLLKALGVIFLVIGLIIVVATGRTLSAEERRVAAGRGLAGRPAKPPVDG